MTTSRVSSHKNQPRKITKARVTTTQIRTLVRRVIGPRIGWCSLEGTVAGRYRPDMRLSLKLVLVMVLAVLMLGLAFWYANRTNGSGTEIVDLIRLGVRP
jgi:hypothetical protein